MIQICGQLTLSSAHLDGGRRGAVRDNGAAQEQHGGQQARCEEHGGQRAAAHGRRQVRGVEGRLQ